MFERLSCFSNIDLKMVEFIARKAMGVGGQRRASSVQLVTRVGRAPLPATPPRSNLCRYRRSLSGTPTLINDIKLLMDEDMTDGNKPSSDFLCNPLTYSQTGVRFPRIFISFYSIKCIFIL